jgi:hypothetical protein
MAKACFLTEELFPAFVDMEKFVSHPLEVKLLAWRQNAEMDMMTAEQRWTPLVPLRPALRQNLALFTSNSMGAHPYVREAIEKTLSLQSSPALDLRQELEDFVCSHCFQTRYESGEINDLARYFDPLASALFPEANSILISKDSIPARLTYAPVKEKILFSLSQTMEKVLPIVKDIPNPNKELDFK